MLLKRSDDCILTEENVLKFRANGHVFLEQLSNRAEIEEIRPIVSEIVASNNMKPSNREDEYSKAFLQVLNTRFESEQLLSFILKRRFASVAAKLLNARAVRIYYDCALFKVSGGGKTPLHIDPFVMDANKVVTMWMPLMDITPSMGSLQFVSGSHLLGDISLSPLQLIQKAVKEALPMVTYGPMKTGDCSFHSGWTIHQAPPNREEYTREVLTVTYYDASAILNDPADNPIRKHHLKDLFPGLKPGEQAATPNNHLVFDESDEMRCEEP